MRLHPRWLAFPFAFLAWAMLAPPASAASCAPQALAQTYPKLAGRTIRIGQDGESPPFSFRDPKDFDHLIGLDKDLADATFACIGVPVRFVTGSWSGLLPALMAGQIDVMWDSLLYTPERAKKVDFVIYMASATGMLVPKGNPRHLHRLEDLCALQAVAGLGTTQEAQLRETSDTCVAAGKPPIQIITASDNAAMIRLVQNSRADVMSGNKFMVESVVQKSPAVFDEAFFIATNARLAVGLPKDDAELARAVDDSLTVLRENGTVQQIFAKYGVEYTLSLPPAIVTQ